MEASEERTLVWFDRRGRSLRELGEPGRYDRPRISPDGRSVAVEIEDPGDGTRNLWIMDAERGLPTRFTASRGKDEHAVWSPDSRRIAFASDRNGSSSIWVQAIEGGDAAEVATLPGRLVPISWSPDGRYLSVAAAADIWIVPLSGAEPYRFASTEEFAEWGATFSPDGQWVAYASNESGSPELYLTSFPTPGRKIRVSPGGGASARWSTNGRELLYVTQESEIYSVAVEIHGRDVAVGATQLLFEESAAREGDVAPDASTLLLLLAPDAADRPPLQLIENWQAGLGKS
jgi:Tol biopolymer transport system component